MRGNGDGYEACGESTNVSRQMACMRMGRRRDREVRRKASEDGSMNVSVSVSVTRQVQVQVQVH